jgi:hypothetical protein
VDVITYWQAQVPSDRTWVAFVHLIDAQGEWASGYDRLDVLPSSWQPGDLAVQVHALWVPPGLVPGLYTLRVGLYDRETMQRLDLAVQPQTGVDHLLVAAVEID